MGKYQPKPPTPIPPEVLAASTLAPDERTTLEEKIEEVLGAVADGRLTAEAPTDTYVGSAPAQLEERDAILDAAAQRTQDQFASSAAERRIRLFEEQLHENTELLKKLAAERGGYTAGVAAVHGLEAERQRRQVYARIERNGGFATISVHTHEDPAQNFPVDVGVNGRLYTLPRGQQLVVPLEVIEVLDHARIEAWVREVGPDGNPVTVRHERMSYPYSLLDYSGQRPESSLHAA